MTTTMGRRERKKLQSKQTILAAAVELFTAKGVRDTSIADIMNKADLGIGTFYNYFESKDAVLLCLLERLVDQIQDYAKKKIESGYPAGEILGAVANLTAELLAEHRYVLPLFLSAAENSAMQAGKGSHLPAPAFKSIFGSIIRYGQQRAEFREEIPAEIVTEMFHAIFQAASFSTLKITFQENISLKIKLILEGIVPRS